eukprot:TRINITY_DN25924_c0_g1_i2.p1 TRINITY_DN25924_c0_g1~~TRINITY_DN25924_c0_g1_i2.p1  ORF type:complete len:178 (-),score=24.81 TRINITY_DN25924_c0_g1_i2:156-689(-)
MYRLELQELGQQAQQVVNMQEALDRKLDLLETHQNKVHSALTDMEATATDLFEKETGQRDAVDNRRMQLYDRAVTVSSELTQIADDLKSAIEKLNASRGGARSGLGPAASIERTLDNQLSALRDIDDRTKDIGRQIERMGAVVEQEVTCGNLLEQIPHIDTAHSHMQCVGCATLQLS